MTRFIALLMAMMILCPCFAVVSHAEDSAPYASAFFTSYGTTLSKEGNGRIKIIFSATGTNICNKIGVASYTVERLDDYGNWVNVSGLLNGSTGTNLNTYTFSRYFNGVRGETYRVQVVFTCIINNDGETQNYTSGMITAK